MNLDFAFLIFCLTVISLVAISNNKDKLAEIAIGSLSNFLNHITKTQKGIKKSDS